VCTFITTALVVRAVGTETFGALAFGLSLVGLIAGLFGGLATAATRSIAAAIATDTPPHRVVGALTAVVLAVSALGGAGLLTAVAVTQRQLETADAWILGAAMCLLLLGRLSAAAGSSVARGNGRVGLMELPPTVEALTKLMLVIVVLVVGARRGWVPIAVVYAGAGVAAAVAAILVVRRALGTIGAIAPAARAGLDLVRLTAPFVVGAVAYRLIHGFDVAVLGVARPGPEVGAYAPTLALVEGVVTLVPGLLSAMFITAATGLWESGDRRGFAALYLTVSKVSVVLAMPAFTLLVVAPADVLRTVYGAPFPTSPGVMWILLGGYFVTVALGFNGQALVASGAWAAVGKALVRPAVTMVASALVLIPALGAVGAAIATTVSFVVLNASLSTALFRTTGVHPLRADRALLLGTAPLSIVVAAGASRAFGDGLWMAVACSIVGWAAWLGLLAWTRTLRLDELRALRPAGLRRLREVGSS
jgi:O-antigen/teichoic acid export membrane protein